MKSININNLTFTYKRGNRVFEGLSLFLKSSLDRGKITVIMGASGSGKTTLLKLLLEVERYKSGNILWKPENPVISYVPQDPVLFEHLSIEQNACYFQFAGAYKKRFNETLYKELVEDLGLKDIISNAKSVNEISGGQKQRLSLLRALSINPDFLLLDEPCNGLDAEVKSAFLNKLREITERYGLFVLYVTHQNLEAQLIADDVVYLVQNKLSGIVNRAVIAPIVEFISSPPVMEAVYVFRFPEVKILPVVKEQDGTVIIAKNLNETTWYWLVEEDNIEISVTDGWPFQVISKSSIYSVIRHEESNTEWIISSSLLNGYELYNEVKIKISGINTEYDKNGLIIK